MKRGKLKMGKRNKVLAFVVISVFILTTFFPATVIAAEDINFVNIQ